MCRIPDVNGADVTERFGSGRINSFALSQSRIDAAHHFTSNHADFVKKHELRILEVFLKFGENVIVFDVVENAEVEPFD